MELPATAGADSTRNPDPGRKHEPPHDPGDSALAANFSPVTRTGQRREATGSVTANVHRTGSGNHMTANGHDRTCRSPKSASSLVETTNSHSESASKLDGPGSGPKTETGTARGQRGSVTSPGESDLIHATANGSWSESKTRETGHTTHQTVSRHDVALPKNSLHMTAGYGKSKSGNGPRKNPQPHERAIVDHTPPRQRTLPREGQNERAQVTPESERAPLSQSPREKKPSRTRHRKPQPSCPPPPPLPPNGERGEGRQHGRCPSTPLTDPALLKDGRQKEEAKVARLPKKQRLREEGSEAQWEGRSRNGVTYNAHYRSVSAKKPPTAP